MSSSLEDRVLEYLARSQRPLKLKEIARGIEVEEQGYPDLKRALASLTEEGRVYRTKPQRYALPEQINLVVGKLDSTRKGAGFVVPEKKKVGEADVFVPPHKLGGAVHGDRVVARQLRDDPRALGHLARRARVRAMERHYPLPQLADESRRRQSRVLREERQEVGLPLDRRRAVLLHELAHVRHRDMLISSVAATLAGAIMVLARFGLFFGGGDRDRGGGALAILVVILAPIAAMLVQAAISRSREFSADAGGAEISGKPRALASALQKLEATAKRVPLQGNPATAHMFIVNPLTGRKVQFANLFRTHPPVEERIALLREM